MISNGEFENVKLLMVGAGGIGCELLKNLVLTGFKNIEVIDLDTIELSNLNRQFLFQKVHVGQPKAVVAKNSVLRMVPDVDIVARHDTIMNTDYNIDYFKQFNLVLNALDNKAARSHVNRLCLAADVPLIESGTAGYLGQVTVIKKQITECYDCLPKPARKTFPGCTIRNTPSEPIHCIVWAKHLFNQLFGAEDPDEAVSPDAEDPENMAEAGRLAAEKTDNVVRLSTRTWAKEHDYDPKKIFNKLFNDDVKYLLSMSKLWEKRKPPTPIDYDTLTAENGHEENGNGEKENYAISTQRLWSIKECLEQLCVSINALKGKLNENEILVWDKDDDDCLVFTTAAANLRSHVFSIDLKSKFDIKSLAGNIIPAIATTNAVIAGLIVLQAIKILRNRLDDCKMVYLRDQPTQKKLIVPSMLNKPNPKCYVCAAQPSIIVKLNLATTTIKQFETKILKQDLNMQQPDVEIDDGTGRIMISSEEGETDDSSDKLLDSYGLKSGSILKCDDFFQNYQLTLTLVHCDKFDNGKDFEIVAEDDVIKNIEKLLKDNSEAASKEADTAKAADNDDDEIIHVITNEPDERKKRSLPDDTEIGTEMLVKKRKILENQDEQQHQNGENGNGNGNHEEIGHKKPTVENGNDLECVELD